MSEKCPINGHRHYGAARRISAKERTRYRGSALRAGPEPVAPTE